MYKEYLKSDLHYQLLEKKAKLDRYVKEIRAFYDEVVKGESPHKQWAEYFLGSLIQTEEELCLGLRHIAKDEMEAAFNSMAAEIMTYMDYGRWPKIKARLLPESDDDPRKVFYDGEDAHMLVTFEFMNRRITPMIWFNFIHEYTEEYMDDLCYPENNTGDISAIEDTKDVISVEIDDYDVDPADAVIKDRFFNVFGDLAIKGEYDKNMLVRFGVRSDDVMDQYLAVLDKIEKEIL